MNSKFSYRSISRRRAEEAVLDGTGEPMVDYQSSSYDHSTNYKVRQDYKGSDPFSDFSLMSSSSFNYFQVKIWRNTTEATCTCSEQSRLCSHIAAVLVTRWTFCMSEIFDPENPDNDQNKKLSVSELVHSQTGFEQDVPPLDLLAISQAEAIIEYGFNKPNPYPVPDNPAAARLLYYDQLIEGLDERIAMMEMGG